MLQSLAPLLLTLGTLLAGGVEVHSHDDVVRARVDRIFADWREGGATSTDAIADDLVALGKTSSPYICRLLDARVVKLPVPAVANALGRLGSRKSIASLKRLARSSVASERLAAVDGLGQMHFRECVPIFVTALGDADAVVAERAESVLLSLRHPPREVVAAVKDRLRLSKDKARLASFLARLGGEAAHTALIGLLGEREDASILAALQGLWIQAKPEDGRVVTDLLEHSTSIAVLKQACLFVGRVRHKPAIRVLIDLLHEPQVAANAHWALKKITGLKLRADADLWGQWWERSGKKRKSR